MFSDDDMNFNLQLEKWGVDTDALKEPEMQGSVLWLGRGVGRGVHKKHNVVDEAKILQKYKNLVFYDSQYEKTYQVFNEHMLWVTGRDKDWYLIAASVDTTDACEDDFKIYGLGRAIQMILTTQQAGGIQVVRSGEEYVE